MGWKKWSESEEQILRDHYADMDKDELMALLPGRTWRSVKWRARQLEITRTASFRTFEHCCDEIDALGLVTCIREEPENFRSSKDKIPFICNGCGERHSAKYHNLRSGTRGCCGDVRVSEALAASFDQCCDEIDAQGLVTCIREEPINFRAGKDKIPFICNGCGERHSAKFGNLRNGARGCCGQGKFKKYLIAFFERQSIEGSAEQEFPDCFRIKGHPLRFDGYIPSANLLIEGQGMQHFREDHHHHNKHDGDCTESYADLHFRDQIKREWAAENGYRLLYIPVEMYDDPDRMDQCILDAMSSTETFIDHCSHLDQEFPSKWLQLFSSPEAMTLDALLPART